MLGRRIVIPLIVVGAVGVGTVAGAMIGVPGLSGASTQSATNVAAAPRASQPGGPRGAMFDAAAKALNLTTAQLMQKLSDGTTTIADVAKQQNVDINTVIDAIAAADRQRIEDFVNNPRPKFGAYGGPAAGPNGPKMGARFGADLSGVAQALGLTPYQLRTELRSGKSIAQIAKDHNVDVNKVIDRIVEDASKKIDRAEQNGRITSQQAEKIKTNLRDAITKIVNGQGPGMFGGFGGLGRFGRGPFGRGGPPAPPGP